MTITVICLAMLIRGGLTLYNRCLNDQEKAIQLLRAGNGQYIEQFEEAERYDPVSKLRTYRKVEKLVEH